MGRYLNTSLCSCSVNKTLKTLLRKYPCLAKRILCLDLHSYSLLSPPHPSRLKINVTFKKSKHSDIDFNTHNFLRNVTKEAKHLQVVRFYSSSNKNTFKAEAPIGIFEEAPNSFALSTLGGRLSQSFNQLSRHINIYFKRQDDEPLAENADPVTGPEYIGRSQRRSQSQRAIRERKIFEEKDTTQTMKCKDKTESSGTSPVTQERTRLQLFHISSLATAFGESYSYVASHINTAFSRSSTKVEIQENLAPMSATRGTIRRQKRRTMQNTAIMNSNKAEKSQVASGVGQAIVEPKSISRSWDEGYLQFAKHVNKYFEAKVTDDVDHNRRQQLPVEKNSPYKKQFATQSTSQTQAAMSHRKQEEPNAPEYGGLFHSSHNTTNFGENYFKLAGYINEYFNGQSDLDEDIDRNLQIQMDTVSAISERPKTVSFMDCLRHPTSAIPDLLGTYVNLGPFAQQDKSKPAIRSPQASLNKKFIMSRRQAEVVSLGLIDNLAQASSPEVLTACVEALNDHVIRYPSCKALMWQEKMAVTLLRKRRTYRDDPLLQSALRESFALIGYVDAVKGRGIRVLSIDGGGTRGVVPLQVLKLLEAETGKKIHELFDYICGVSTGAVLAFMLGLAHFSLEECAEMYSRFGSEVFRQNPLVGTVKMGWSHSYYSTETWEKILREKLGDKLLIKTARDENSPKVSAVSAVVNWGTSPKAFVFRNYNHIPGSLSRYSGASGCQMWEAVRASSAAPGYFQEFTLQSDIHQDGGILLNNPCSLAVHESRLLWPNQPFQCVLSLGTGRYDNAKRATATSTSLRAKISNLICSATDTEGVHTLLDDLLAPDVYFRFNPMLSAVVSLDESRPQAMHQLQRDTQNYLERNRPKLARLCLVLGAERSPVSRTKDWMDERAWEMKQRWV